MKFASTVSYLNTTLTSFLWKVTNSIMHFPQQGPLNWLGQQIQKNSGIITQSSLWKQEIKKTPRKDGCHKDNRREEKKHKVHPRTDPTMIMEKTLKILNAATSTVFVQILSMCFCLWLTSCYCAHSIEQWKVTIIVMIDQNILISVGIGIFIGIVTFANHIIFGIISTICIIRAIISTGTIDGRTNNTTFYHVWILNGCISQRLTWNEDFFQEYIDIVQVLHNQIELRPMCTHGGKLFPMGFAVLTLESPTMWHQK